MIPFANPYRGKTVPTIRVDIAIDQTEYERIRSVLTNPSDLTSAYAMWIKWLNDHITRNDYTFLNRETFIADILGLLNKESSRDDGRGVDRVDPVREESLHQHSTFAGTLTDPNAQAKPQKRRKGLRVG